MKVSRVSCLAKIYMHAVYVCNKNYYSLYMLYYVVLCCIMLHDVHLVYSVWSSYAHKK